MASLLINGAVTVDNEENLRPRSDSLCEQSSFTENDGKVERSTSLPKSKSWSNSPRLRHGIPLGSLTAQEAAKSFWTMDMLQERIQKMAKYAALETSSLGSSIDDDSLSTTEEDLEEIDTPIIPNTTTTDLVVRSAPVTPRQHSPAAVLRSQSAQLTCSGGHVTRTQPFLSPRIAACTRLSTRRAVQSASSLRSASRLTNASFVVEGKQVQLSQRNFSPAQDDGFYE